MSWYNPWKKESSLNESNKKFKNVAKYKKDEYGEGYDNISDVNGFGITSVSSFNMFYSKYIDNTTENERAKIRNYRQIACMPEVGDVIEDAVIESIQPNLHGEILTLTIKDDTLSKNKNAVDTITDEFKTLFFNRLNISDILWEITKTLYVDGRYYLERIPAKVKKNGIIGLKKLPSETMDYNIDVDTGKINAFYQYLSPNAKQPESLEKASVDNGVIGFYPSQISFVNSGDYGISKKEIIGYLEKVKTPYNQLKLLETSVIIYRIIRAPQRLVFRIDTGNMPKDKASKYVEKIKRKFTQKESFDPETGQMQGTSGVMSILSNYFLAQSADGRGSQIDEIGGNPSGFAELDDIHYFQKKLYKALKYPMSRVNQIMENQQSDSTYMGGSVSEITRDEVKWAKFLQRSQFKICEDLLDIFLVHLEFKGLKKQYELTKHNISIDLTPPNNYIEQMNQLLIENDMNNYQNLANNEEFSKSYLMKKYLGYTEEDFELLKEGFEKDKTLFPKEEGY